MESLGAQRRALLRHPAAGGALSWEPAAVRPAVLLRLRTAPGVALSTGRCRLLPAPASVAARPGRGPPGRPGLHAGGVPGLDRELLQQYPDGRVDPVDLAGVGPLRGERDARPVRGLRPGDRLRLPGRGAADAGHRAGCPGGPRAHGGSLRAAPPRSRTPAGLARSRGGPGPGARRGPAAALPRTPPALDSEHRPHAVLRGPTVRRVPDARQPPRASGGEHRSVRLLRPLPADARGAVAGQHLPGRPRAGVRRAGRREAPEPAVAVVLGGAGARGPAAGAGAGHPRVPVPVPVAAAPAAGALPGEVLLLDRRRAGGAGGPRIRHCARGRRPEERPGPGGPGGTHRPVRGPMGAPSRGARPVRHGLRRGVARRPDVPAAGRGSALLRRPPRPGAAAHRGGRGAAGRVAVAARRAPAGRSAPPGPRGG